ncbi:MAG: GTP-binding protein LepA [Parcubacteria group bacterium Athens1014_10]|nr:MAG: GTP-binding protein LepA [Parcubacteria group bacterium Athens1014_10]
MSFQENIRNFAIISHIDHGKSTLADRFLELTGTIAKDKMQAQFLDQMDLERERGITIKLQPVKMLYKVRSPKSEIRNSKQIQNPNNQNLKQSNLEFADSEYILNLIDTPGHVDFNYEVSRSLAAVEGAVLLVDATQGIQAQTLANLHLALEQNLVIIPVVNKIDMPNASIDETKEELSKLLNINKEEILECSAKLGTGVEKILESIIKKVPAPKEEKEKSLQALIFDSEFDDYKGVIAYVRIFDGQVKRGDKIKFLANQKECESLEVGIFNPKLISKDILKTGEIGYIATGLKEIEKCKVGDTIALLSSKVKQLKGYKEIKPMVFAGIYCKQGSDFQKLRNSLEKLKLNDASLFFEPESSPALGYGFRAGFLGMLHLEIIQERLRREYNLDLIITTPSVAYKIAFKDDSKITIKSPQEFPDPSKVSFIEEPVMKIEIITPSQYMGRIMDLLKEKRGEFISSQYLAFEAGSRDKRLILEYKIPLSSLLYDFYDKLKTVSSGYASLNYEFLEYKKVDLVKVDILVAEDKVEPLSTLVYRDKSYQIARKIVDSLKDVLPRQMFEVKIQAAIGGKVIAAERISALRKDVIAKLYGGDVTRKMKLLEKQKKGKKKMKKIGKVDIPPQAYIAILKR